MENIYMLSYIIFIYKIIYKNFLYNLLNFLILFWKNL